MINYCFSDYLRFYAIGYILYFPSNDPYWRWPPNHDSVLIITVLFIWLGLLVCIFLFIQTAIVWFMLKRRYGDLNHYSVLNDDDDNHRIENGTNHQLELLKRTNGNGITHMGNHDDDDSDSQIEFLNNDDNNHRKYEP